MGVIGTDQELLLSIIFKIFLADLVFDTFACPLYSLVPLNGYINVFQTVYPGVGSPAASSSDVLSRGYWH